MPAVSKKQQQFFGIVRAIQKGEQAPTTPETAKAAADMKKSDVKKFASTKHKGLPNKVVQKEESNPRIPRKKGQPAGSKKHSDLYTDENPKGTIHGLGFKDVATAKASVSKIRNSSRSHAHKIQAAVAMEQRAREMGKTSEAAVYRKFINTMKKKTKQMNEEGLRAWFGKSRSKDGKPGWVQVVSGKPCARSPGQKSAPKCVSSAKRASMTDAERKSAQARKRRADPNQAQKSGAAKPTYVSTDPKKKKVSEAMNFIKFKSRAMDAAKKAVAKKSSSSYVGQRDAGAIAAKKMRQKDQEKVNFLPVEEGMSYGLYKGSGKPSGAMAGFDKKEKEKKKETKKESLTMMILGKEVELKEKCWKGYEKKGMKTMFGKRYPNCVKKEEVEIEEKKMVKVKLNPEKKIGVKVTDIGPGGKEVVRKNTMDEGAEVVTEVKDKKGKGSGSKDACYHKVKSRYSVWPSAYASGALVKCRKVGAANWGNSSKKEEFSDWKSEFIWEDENSVDEMFGGSSSGGRADRGDEVGRRERVKRAQEAKAKRAAVKDTPIDKYKPSPAMARYLAKTKKEEVIWEDGDSVKKITEDDMKGMSVKSGHKRPTKSGAGMTAKGVAAYRRRNPGSKLKTAVTTKPSKLKKGSKAANRRKSYCARSAGQMKKFPKAAKDPNSRLRQARRRWNC